VSGSAGRSGGSGKGGRFSLPRAEMLLPIAIVAAAGVLAASEFMVAFQFTPPGGEPLREVTGGDRHGYALAILAAFSVLAMLFATTTGSRPGAYAVAASGAVALLLFLILDLPDAGKVGDLEDPARCFAQARAEPQAGFWMEALGALALAIAGGAFATLNAGQLRAPAERLTRGRRVADRGASGEGSGAGEAPSGPRDRAGAARLGRKNDPPAADGDRSRHLRQGDPARPGERIRRP
jgi:hypothetical protein